MSKRKKMNRKTDRKVFKKTSGSDKKNRINTSVMRGGYRL